MNRALIQKGIGGALVLSGVVLFVLKVSSTSEARQGWDSWASPESGVMWFVGVLALEVAFLVSRFVLGYFVFQSKNMGPWLFYPLAILNAVSGLSGIVLVAAVLVIRFWQGGVHAVKT